MVFHLENHMKYPWFNTESSPPSVNNIFLLVTGLTSITTGGGRVSKWWKTHFYPLFLWLGFFLFLFTVFEMLLRLI